jgi:hypothetical protein
VNVAVVAFAATVTLAGTVVAPVLLLLSATTAPPPGAGPLNVTVPVDVLPPVTVVGFSPTELGTGSLPVPVRPTVCGLPAALSVRVTAALPVPVAVGVNVTLMLQFAPAATLVPQLFDWLKSPLLAPVTAMLLIVKVALPVFVSVTLCALLLVPTSCEA